MLLLLAMIDSEEDKSKFELLYNQYRQLMFYIANGVLHDDNAAEDAVQQAFIKIIENLEKIYEVNCPKTKSYVVIIVKHISLDMLKHRNRHMDFPFEELEIGDHTSGDFTYEADEDAGYRTLVSAIQSLPKTYTDILLLKYVHGYSVEEISAMLNLSIVNVRKIIQRARNKLELILKKEGVMDDDCG